MASVVKERTTMPSHCALYDALRSGYLKDDHVSPLICSRACLRLRVGKRLNHGVLQPRNASSKHPVKMRYVKMGKAATTAKVSVRCSTSSGLASQNAPSISAIEVPGLAGLETGRTRRFHSGTVPGPPNTTVLGIGQRANSNLP